MSRRKVYVAGVAESDLGSTPDQTVLSLQAQAARKALDETGLAPSDIQGLFTAGDWSWSTVLLLAEYLGIQPTYLDGTDIGGSSFEAHVQHAAAAIESGRLDVALITYGSTQRSDSGRNQPRPARLTEQFEQPFGMPMWVGSYAMAAQRYLHQYGGRNGLSEIAVSTREWASMNPLAWSQKPITVEDVETSRSICDPLRLLDCCLVTDGGGAVVLVSEDRLADLRSTPVEVLGMSEISTHSTITSMPDLLTTGASVTGPAALGMAGLTHADIDVAQIYDSFTITVMLSLESLGFCGPGEGADFVSGGRIRPGGDLPLNTNGGGLSYCHPGMYGIFLIIEAVRQLRGESGARQVPGAATALVHGTGGVLSSSSTLILGRN